jgi:hypothetical protein
MGLQVQYDLDVAEDALGAWLDREVCPFAAGKSGNSRLR